MLQKMTEVVGIPFLEIIPFAKEGEAYVSGETMMERAKELGADCGKGQAEYLLEHEEEVPREWKDYVMIFPGTVCRRQNGSLEVTIIAYFANWFMTKWTFKPAPGSYISLQKGAGWGDPRYRLVRRKS